LLTRTDLAQSQPTLLDKKLQVTNVASDLTTPISMAFLGSNDFLVIEKNTGKVKRIINGDLDSTVLDLAVNFASERGLLGIALHPQFPANPGVYLYWTCSSAEPTDTFVPSTTECPDTPALGDDTDAILRVPLLGNRVDRFTWDGTALTFD